MHWQECIKWIIFFGKDNRGNGIFSWSALLVKSPSQAKYTSNPVDDLSYKRKLADLLNQIGYEATRPAAVLQSDLVLPE